MTFVNQIKYHPNIELSFLKKYFGKSKKGKPIKHDNNLFQNISKY